MKKKTIFITGAGEGLGKLTAIGLATQYNDADILIHGRNKERLNKSSEEIKKATGSGNIETYLADFSSLDEVRKMAEDVLKKHATIDILINNAGAGFTAPRFGIDGTETRFAVNYLAPFLLTRLLLPSIILAGSARIINVASAAQSPIHFDDIMMEKEFDGVTAYTRSKLAIIMFTFDLADELQKQNVTVNCLHPGTYLDTGMVRDSGIRPMGTAQSGADAIIYLAVSPELQYTTGKYFDIKKETAANAQAYDLNARNKLNKIGNLYTEPGIKSGMI